MRLPASRNGNISQDSEGTQKGKEKGGSGNDEAYVLAPGEPPRCNANCMHLGLVARKNTGHLDLI